MNAHKQRGMVLLVSLILLLMLTLIAITASSQSTLQLRISSNSEQNNLAFQAAEAGIAAWVGTYFAIPLHEVEKVHKAGEVVISTPQDTVFGINEHGPIWPCGGLTPGSPAMFCFDLTVTGGSVCDNSDIDTCAVTTTHRQGGQRRGEIQGEN